MSHKVFHSAVHFDFGLISTFFVIKWGYIFMFIYLLWKIYETQVPKYLEHLHESGNFIELIGDMVHRQISTSEGTQKNI